MQYIARHIQMAQTFCNSWWACSILGRKLWTLARIPEGGNEPILGGTGGLAPALINSWEGIILPGLSGTSKNWTELEEVPEQEAFEELEEAPPAPLAPGWSILTTTKDKSYKLENIIFFSFTLGLLLWRYHYQCLLCCQDKWIGDWLNWGKWHPIEIKHVIYLWK